MPGDLERVARAHRREILDVDRALATALLDAYATAWQVRIRPALDLLTARIQAARDAGHEPDAGWLARESRLRDLEDQVTREITGIARNANGGIGAARFEAIRLAQTHAAAATEAALGDPPAGIVFSFAQLPTEAVRALVADLAPEASLGALLAALVPAARESVRAALLDGLILGESPAAMARRMRAALGGNASKAIQIARDSTLTAYSRGSLAAYAQNVDVVRGWRWLCARSIRTCGYCWAMDGRVFPLETPMARHSRCRCCPQPVLHEQFASDQPAPQTGPEAFAALDADDQRRVLGPSKQRAYANGLISLGDLVGTADAGAFGRVGFERSLTAIVGAEQAKKLIAGARA